MSWWSDHRNLILSTVVSTSISLGVAGCALFPSKTFSPLDGKKISRPELDAEVLSFKAKSNASYALLDAEDKAKSEIADIVIKAASAVVPIPYQNLALAVASVATAGAVTDNIRVRKSKKTT